MPDKFYLDNQNKPQTIVLIFIAIQCVFGVSFVCLDFFTKGYGAVSSTIKFLTIILCFLFSCIPLQENFKRSEEVNRRLAMGFTLCADVFLLFRVMIPYDFNDSIGVSFFCLAQYFHLKSFQGNWKMWRWVLCFLPIGWILFLSVRNITASILLVGLILIYATLITVNFFTALKQYRADKYQRAKQIRLAGMILFLACDLCVFIYQLAVQLDNRIFSFVFVIYLSWVFYLPSQVLLVLASLFHLSNGTSKQCTAFGFSKRYEKRKIVQTNRKVFLKRKGEGKE